MSLPFHIREPAWIGIGCSLAALALLLFKALIARALREGGCLGIRIELDPDFAEGVRRRANAVWYVVLAIPLSWSILCLCVAAGLIQNGPEPDDPFSLPQSPLHEKAKTMSMEELKAALKEAAKRQESQEPD